MALGKNGKCKIPPYNADAGHIHATIYEFLADTTLLGVLEHIHENWDIMTQDDCLPVHVALQLMDHSSLGRGGDYQDFQKTSKQLQKALKAIVNGMTTADTPPSNMLMNLRASSGVQ